MLKSLKAAMALNLNLKGVSRLVPVEVLLGYHSLTILAWRILKAVCSGTLWAV